MTIFSKLGERNKTFDIHAWTPGTETHELHAHQCRQARCMRCFGSVPWRTCDTFPSESRRPYRAQIEPPEGMHKPKSGLAAAGRAAI